MNPNQLMKQAMRIQADMARVQESLANRTVEGVAGGGAVRAIAKCDQTLVSVKISPDAMNPQDVAFLEDLVLTAVNQALTQAKETANREMGAVTKGLSIPGLM
jgi:DNA-binding YbaB/EbfC family protein